MCRSGFLLLVIFLTGCASSPEGELAFGVLGDTPYSDGEVRRLDALIDDMNRSRLAFVVHLGDIGSSVTACDDSWLQARKRQFARLKHRLVVIPGDNEWTDCRDPAARLAAWRKLFCEVPLEVERQRGEYCEHVRWSAAGFLFVALNVAGSNNNLRRDPGESARRMERVHAWLDESAQLAERSDRTLVIFMQANPFISLPRDGYVELRERLIRLGQKRPYRTILVHGDTHVYHDDEPIRGMRRLEVWGSPIVSWIRADADGADLRFSAPRYR